MTTKIKIHINRDGKNSMHFHVNKRSIMSESLFDAICKIAKRNGSILNYPINVFIDEDSKESFITCDECFGSFPETASMWLFYDVKDEEAIALLKMFFQGYHKCSFEICRHFAHLLALKGKLVMQELSCIIKNYDWSLYNSPNVFLAGLAQISTNMEHTITSMLDVVPNNERFGLLTACWHCDCNCVQEKVLMKFEEWIIDPNWGNGDGEDVWLRQFLYKWIKEFTFSYQRLENLLRWYFLHVGSA